MRITVEVFGLTLDLTLGPTEYEAEPDGYGGPVDTLSADLTHGDGWRIGFTQDVGPDYYAE